MKPRATVSLRTDYLVAIRVGAERILCGQHGRRNENAGEDDVAKVVVVAEPVAEHSEPFAKKKGEVAS